MEQAQAPERPRYVLQLYVSGMLPHSSRAIANLKAICEKHLVGRYDLTITDVYQQPVRITQDEILAVPMLIKQFPLPMRRIVGDFSDTVRTLLALDLEAPE